MIGAGFRMVSAGTDVFALIKIGAIVFGVVGIAGLGYAGCSKLMNAGLFPGRRRIGSRTSPFGTPRPPASCNPT